MVSAPSAICIIKPSVARPAAGDDYLAYSVDERLIDRTRCNAPNGAFVINQALVDHCNRHRLPGSRSI